MQTDKKHGRQDRSRPIPGGISSLTKNVEHETKLLNLAASVGNDENFNFFVRQSALDVARNKERWPVVLVIERGEQIVAYGHLEAFPGDELKRHVVKLGIYVRPEWRSNGFGNAMMRALIGAAKEYGYEKIWLSTHSDNSAAVGLYTKHGFVVEGVFQKEEKLGNSYRSVVSMALFL